MENNKRVRLGIIGPGAISRLFAEGAKEAHNIELAAVASRDKSRAEVFAESFGIETVHDSYQALLQDETIELVYIGLINTRHFYAARQAILAGKGVILEKPLTLNAYEAKLLIDLAKEENVFLMEAMWTRFHPINRKVLDWIEDGEIGDIKRVEVSFGYFGGDDETLRYLNPELGGSALLDVGIYPLAYASMLLGPPKALSGKALQTAKKVDRQIEITAVYENATASLAASVENQLPNKAVITGTEGIIEVPFFFNPKEASLYRFGDTQESPYDLEERIVQEFGSGYRFEAEAAADAYLKGWTEHPWLSLDESLQLMEQMDDLRHTLDLTYPAERAVLFDCDGVLVDSEALLAKQAAKMLNEKGIPAKPEDFVNFIGTGEDRYLEGVIELYDGTYDPALKRDLYTHYLAAAPTELQEVKGAKALVETLLKRSIRVAVASAADKIKVDANLSAFGIEEDGFDAVISGSDVEKKKPHPDIYLKAARAVGVKPEHCIVVEDAEAGIQSAKAAGMFAIGITTAVSKERLFAAGADQVVDTIDAMYPLLGI